MVGADTTSQRQSARGLDTVQTPFPSAYSPMESYLIQYYLERSSQILVNVDSPTNSLRSIVLPRTTASSMLSNAVYAVTSMHASISSDRSDLRITALLYFGRATKALQEGLYKFGLTTTRTDRECALLTTVMFCKYEIVSGGFKDWRSHLRGLHGMLETTLCNDLDISPEVTSYVRSL